MREKVDQDLQAHRRRDHRRAPEARRPAAGRQRVGLPPHGGRAQARRQRAALDRRGRSREDPRRRRPPARGDRSPRPTATRRASRARATPRRRRSTPRRSARTPSSTRSTAAWRPTAATFRSKNDVMVLEPNSDFLRYFRDSLGRSPRSRENERMGTHVPHGARPDAGSRRRAAVPRAEPLARHVPPASPQMTDGQIRFVGLSSMIVGLLLLLLAESWLQCMKLAPARVHRGHPARRGARIERLRRAHPRSVLRANGYELVMPPLLEYLDSLLTGTGHDLDLRTFKLVDQLSGRMLGVRADITPQVARIDAHLLNRKGVTRLCYCGSVLHTRAGGPGGDARADPDRRRDLRRRRASTADLEILRLLCEALELAGVRDAAPRPRPRRGVPRARPRRRKSSAERRRRAVRGAAARRTLPALRELTKGLHAKTRDALLALPELYGGAEVLDARREAAAEARRAVARRSATLRALAKACQRAASSFDLADLRGYHYHSGVVFAAYCDGAAGAAARHCARRTLRRGRQGVRPRAAWRPAFSIDLAGSSSRPPRR